MIWSQPHPPNVASFGNIVVGSTSLKFAPPSVEIARLKFVVIRTTVPATAPLTSGG